MSLEIPLSFRECFLEGDPTRFALAPENVECAGADGTHCSLYYVARSLMTLQAQFGVIPTIYGKVCNFLRPRTVYFLSRVDERL